MRTNELILYRYMEHEDLLRDMTFLIDNADTVLAHSHEK